MVAACVCPSAEVRADTPAPAAEPKVELRLSDLRLWVLQRNETLQERLLNFESQRRRARGEYGLFEPQIYGSYTHEINNRKNTAEQATTLLGAPTFTETNNNYESGIESFVPSGAQVKLGYTLRDLQNSLQPARSVTNGEYQTFFGLTVVQPLLKNFGTAATLAGLRMAAISNKMAFQAYRRDLMSVLSGAEATYWNLYLAQEQVHFFQESVKTAETILRDNRTRLQAGKGSELEVLEAEAGLGLRRAKLGEAQQKVVEVINRVITLIAAEAPPGDLAVHAADVPELTGQIPDYSTLRREVFDSNPDYLIAVERVQEGLVKLGYARNQRLPEVDIKGSYGLNGLGDNPGASWNDIEHQTEPSWYIGAEFHIPLAGGVKTRNELIATRLDLQSSETSLRGLETELLNAINTAWRKMQSTRGSVGNYQTAVQYNQSVLEAALTRLDAGKIESRKVLEIEADLLEARVSLVEALVHYELACLELELTQGVFLQRRHLELTQHELALATQHIGQSRNIRDASYQEGLNEFQRLRQESQAPPDAAQSSRQRALSQQMIDWQKQTGMKNEVQSGFIDRPELAPRSTNPALDPNDTRFAKPPPAPPAPAKGP
jgi:outer membrane protein TolC